MIAASEKTQDTYKFDFIDKKIDEVKLFLEIEKNSSKEAGFFNNRKESIEELENLLVFLANMTDKNDIEFNPYAYALRLDEMLQDIKQKEKSLTDHILKDICHELSKHLTGLKHLVHQQMLFDNYDQVRNALVQQIQAVPAAKKYIYDEILQEPNLSVQRKLSQIDNLDSQNIKNFSELKANAYFIVSLDAFFKGEIDIIDMNRMLNKISEINPEISTTTKVTAKKIMKSYIENASKYHANYKQLHERVESGPSPAYFTKKLQEAIEVKKQEQGDIQQQINDTKFWNVFKKFKLHIKKFETDRAISTSEKHLEILNNGRWDKVATTMRHLMMQEAAARPRLNPIALIA